MTRLPWENEYYAAFAVDCDTNGNSSLPVRVGIFFADRTAKVFGISQVFSLLCMESGQIVLISRS